nr:unnamed protein product [Digitaria exilis]
MDQSISKRLRPVAPEVIPDEVLLFKILVDLPVKSLVRFKSVCKAWRATIASAHFVRLHLELARACSPSVVLVPRKWQPEPTKVASRFVYIYSFQQPPVQVAKLIMKTKPCPTGCIPRFTIPLHCDGLILIPSVTGHVFVCNPATKEFVELPPGTPNALLDQRVAFGFDPSSETLEWKATIDPPYPIKGRTPICLPGFFYWSAVQSVADADQADKDMVFLAVDARNLFKCNLRDGSLETVVDMRFGLKYNRGEGVNFIHGSGLEGYLINAQQHSENVACLKGIEHAAILGTQQIILETDAMSVANAIVRMAVVRVDPSAQWISSIANLRVQWFDPPPALFIAILHSSIGPTDRCSLLVPLAAHRRTSSSLPLPPPPQSTANTSSDGCLKNLEAEVFKVNKAALLDLIFVDLSLNSFSLSDLC